MLAVAALGAAACSGDPSPEPPSAGAETPTILATTSIWADVVANVACDGLAEVEAIIPIGSDPHGYEPSLQDPESMTNALLVVANGLTLEGRLEDTLDAVAASGTPVLDFAVVMDPIPFEGHDDHEDEGHDDHEDEMALAAHVGDIDVITLYTGSLGPPGSGAETYTGYLRTNTDLIVDSLN